MEETNKHLADIAKALNDIVTRLDVQNMQLARISDASLYAARVAHQAGQPVDYVVTDLGREMLAAIR